MSEDAKKPENVVGMHYFSVTKMPLLEIIKQAKLLNKQLLLVMK